MMLEVRNLSVSYGMHRALFDVGIHVAPGEIAVILGANGAGKSSLLNAIAGMSQGTVAGDVSLDGTSLNGVAADRIVEMGIAFVPEGRGIFGDLTVAENLLLGAYSSNARNRQEENLAQVYSLFPKLTERRSQIARTMSGGEQQMVAIGRAMMANPKILMLDEPSLGLSPLLCKELFQNLAQIRETGIGVLLVEQNAKQSLAIADRGYLIENGTITGENDARSLLNDPAVQKAYLGGAASDGINLKPEPTLASTEAPVGPVTDADKQFIQPRDVIASEKSTEALAGEAIATLVARASEKDQSVSSIAGAPQSEEPLDTGRVSRDPEIEKLLNEIETAARSARNPNSAPKAANNRKPPETYTDLPEIPVYRKSAIQVFRRDPDGNLVKKGDS